ncbi:hypothetical protein H2O73_03780 [Vibrio sp. 404]|uniref:Uncharacterized protein n=1 Tax=Vibrio marinisediminis TaxID=2758441 RepID=A0A7W2FNP8_9VIBR|nr:hypothetical protein [Vibrio marinisediminis]MBA5761456.1 hypothetical protein [Vibrio marinisediminis]
MEGIFGGVVSGLLTSLAVGVFLIWKGDSLVRSLRNMPNGWKAKFLTTVYLKSIRQGQYSYAHSQFTAFTSVIYLGFLAFAIVAYFKLETIRDNLELGAGSLENAVEETTSVSFFTDYGGVIILIYVFFTAYVFLRHFYKSLVDATSPVCAKEFDLLDRAVQKCGSQDQYIKFLNLRASCNSREEVLEWLKYGNSCIGAVQLINIEEIIQSISLDDNFGVVTFPSVIK